MQRTNEWACPRWIVEALIALRPPGRMRVSQWADAYRILEGKTSNLSGKWRTSLTPYLRDIMDAFTDPEVEEGSLIKPTQCGGSQALLNMLGYLIDRDPDPTMIVYPDESLAEFTSTKRIQPMIMACPALRDKFDENSPMLSLDFDDMIVVLASANSATALSSTSMRYLFMDEVDKFPLTAGKEASPRALARERTRTYPGKKKIFSFSTPTFEDGPIWQDWLNADSQYEYFVRCPHCGEWWTFKFSNLEYDKSSPDAAQRSALYVCKPCGSCINDRERREMVQNGEWRTIRSNGKRRIAFHLNAFCSPWISLGDIAYEFERSKKVPEDLMNFTNSWLAEPFKDVTNTVSAEYLLKNKVSQFAEGEVPPETILLTGGVDVQKECFYWSVRSWMPNMSSYNVAHGKAFTWQEIEYAMNLTYRDRTGTDYIVNLCCIDSGDQTDDVYNFCAVNSEWSKPVKGASTRLTGKYRESVIDKVGSKANGMLLYLVDTNYYKDMIFSRIRRNADNGGWFIHMDCDAEYCEMVCAEHKVLRKYNNRLQSVWEQKTEGRDNHYLDCEVYAALAADLMGLRQTYAASANEQQTETAAPPPVEPTQQYHSPYGNPLSHSRKRWFR